jgi:hypothetical protein
MRNPFQAPQSLFLVLCSLFVVLSAVACGDDTPISPDEPDDPVLVTETFSGTINRNGAATHTFNTTVGGEMSATLTSLSPDESIMVGFAVGLWNGSVCNVQLVRDEAVESTVIYGTVNASGELCVRIYDVGRVANSTNYEITVTHP